MEVDDEHVEVDCNNAEMEELEGGGGEGLGESGRRTGGRGGGRRST